MKTELNQKLMELKLRKEELKKQTAEAARIKKMVSVYQKKVESARECRDRRDRAGTALGTALGPCSSAATRASDGGDTPRARTARSLFAILVASYICDLPLYPLMPHGSHLPFHTPSNPPHPFPFHPRPPLLIHVPLHSFTGGAGDRLEVTG